MSRNFIVVSRTAPEWVRRALQRSGSMPAFIGMQPKNRHWYWYTV